MIWLSIRIYFWFQGHNYCVLVVLCIAGEYLVRYNFINFSDKWAVQKGRPISILLSTLSLTRRTSSSDTCKTRSMYSKETSKNSSNSKTNIEHFSTASDYFPKTKYSLSYPGSRRCRFQGEARPRPSHHLPDKEWNRRSEGGFEREKAGNERLVKRLEHSYRAAGSEGDRDIEAEERTPQPSG